MGMLGALGKTNLVSGNLLPARHCSARNDLERENGVLVSLLDCLYGRGFLRLPSCAADRELTLLVCLCDNTDAGAFHLSPRPWATMTVEVCLLKAGTTNAALLDILCGNRRLRIVEVGLVKVKVSVV